MPLVDDFLAAALRLALDAIADDARECVVLFYSEGQSVEQVASLLGLSATAVRKRLERARKQLRHELLQHLGAEAVRLRASLPATVMTAIAAEAQPRSESAIAVATAAVAAAPLSGLLGAMTGVLGAIVRMRHVTRRIHGANTARRFAASALTTSMLLGVLLPLRYPRLLWMWFVAYQAVVALTIFWWLPRHGVSADGREVTRWGLWTTAGALAVWCAVSNMG